MAHYAPPQAGHGGLPYNTAGQLTTGKTDYGLGEWFATNFTDRSSMSSTTGPLNGESRTHYQLSDQKSTIAKLPPIYLLWTIGQFSWVNQSDFIPAQYSTSLEFSQEFIEFDEGVLPEDTPEESVSRTFKIKKSMKKFRSRRVGLQYEWSVDNLFSPEGKQEFAMFTAKIAQGFAEHIALTSLVRLLEPNHEDAFYLNVFGTNTMLQKINQIMKEVKDTWAAHKQSAGPFPRLFAAAQEMVRYNPSGGEPNYALYDPRYQALFKFFMQRTSQYDKAGPPAVGMLTGSTEVLEFGKMKVRPVDSFPQENVFDDEVNFMSRTCSHGSVFVWRNVMLDYKPSDVKISLQGYIILLDETQDLSPVKIGLAALNQANLDWHTESGELHPAFEGVEEHMYTYLNNNNEWTRARYIGDMKDTKLPRHLMEGMVRTVLKDETCQQLNALYDGIRAGIMGNTLNDFVNNNYADLSMLYTRFRLMFGAEKNFLFTEADPDAGDIAIFIRNIFDFTPAAPIEAPLTTGGLNDELEHEFNQITAGLATHNMSTRGTQTMTDDIRTSLTACIPLVTGLPVGNASDMAIKQKMLDNLDKYLKLHDGDECNLTRYLATKIRTYLTEVAGRQRTIANAEKWITVCQAAGETEDPDKEFDAMLAKYNPDPKKVPSGAPIYKGPLTTSNPKPYRHVSDFGANSYTDGRAGVSSSTRPKAKRYRGYEEFEYDGRADVIVDNDQFNVNIKNVQTRFHHPVDRAVAYMLLATPLTRQSMDTLIRNDVFPPCEYIIFRPFLTRGSSMMVLVQGGAGLGMATYGYPNIMVGENSMNKTGNYHVTSHHGAAILNHKRRKFEHNMFYQETRGGGNVKFMTHDDWALFVEQGYSFNGDESFPANLCFSIPVGSTVKMEFTDLRGKSFHEERDFHYEGSAYAVAVLNLDSVVGGDCLTIYDRNLRQLPNMICFHGTQVQCGDVSGKPGIVHENQGHDGIERPGDLRMRRGGMGVREDTTPPLF